MITIYNYRDVVFKKDCIIVECYRIFKDGNTAYMKRLKKEIEDGDILGFELLGGRLSVPDDEGVHIRILFPAKNLYKVGKRDICFINSQQE